MDLRLWTRPRKNSLIVGAAAAVFLCLVGTGPEFAQFHLPKMPGSSGHNDDSRGRRRHDDGTSVNPPGVPVPPDAPIFVAFHKLQQQSVYHQKMTINAADPQMQQMMAQMGFMPAETITAGDLKAVSMHFKMPIDGQPEDIELRSVSGNGRMAKKWVSPAKDRILAKQDAQIDSQLAQYEAQAGPSIAKDLAMGPMGIVSAGVESAAAAASVAEAAAAHKQAHSFWEWSCMDGGPKTSRSDSQASPPPLTDLKLIGDDNIEGVPVTVYEFYVQENGKFHGPMQMSVTKDSGLPRRIGMNDPRAGGGMQMDYYGFNQGGDFEVPPCMTH